MREENAADMPPRPKIELTPDQREIADTRERMNAAIRRIGETSDGKQLARMMRLMLYSVDVRVTQHGAQFQQFIPDNNALLISQGKKILAHSLLTLLDNDFAKETKI